MGVVINAVAIERKKGYVQQEREPISIDQEQDRQNTLNCSFG